MKQRLFLHRIVVDGARIAIGQAVKGAVHIHFGSAGAAIPRGQNTTIRTNKADDFLVLQFFIHESFVGPFPQGCGRPALENFATNV